MVTVVNTIHDCHHPHLQVLSQLSKQKCVLAGPKAHCSPDAVACSVGHDTLSVNRGFPDLIAF